VIMDTLERCSKTFDLSETKMRIDTSLISSTKCGAGYLKVFKS